MTAAQFKAEVERLADKSGLSEADILRALDEVAAIFTPVFDDTE